MADKKPIDIILNRAKWNALSEHGKELLLQTLHRTLTNDNCTVEVEADLGFFTTILSRPDTLDFIWKNTKPVIKENGELSAVVLDILVNRKN